MRVTIISDSRRMDGKTCYIKIVQTEEMSWTVTGFDEQEVDALASAKALSWMMSANMVSGTRGDAIEEIS